MNLVRESSALDAEPVRRDVLPDKRDRAGALDPIAMSAAMSAVRNVLRVHKVPTYCPAPMTKQ
jgi:hypothetical protein